MTAFWRKLHGWWRRDAIDAELQEEIRTHLDMKAADLGGPSPARHRFGNPALVLEDARSVWGNQAVRRPGEVDGHLRATITSVSMQRPIALTRRYG